MSEATRNRLASLLPAVYRIRDDRDQPLQALLDVVGSEFDRVEADVARLYDDWFIETCQEWVVPYIGDLLGVRAIRSVESARVSLRAYVANTLAYRRRKGTATVLEQLARDTTGWPARAVEFFARLATTQHLNHVRLVPPATAAIRDAEAVELAGSAFDPLAHSVDVRRIASGRGRHNIPNVGIFLWRLQSYPVGRGEPGGDLVDFGTARRMAGSPWTYFTFHPVGRDAPLFNAPQTEEAVTHLAEEENVPGELRRLAIHEELESLRRAAATSPPRPPERLRFLSDLAPVFRVRVKRTPGGPTEEIPRERIFLCEIPDTLDVASPPELAVAIDPERGRLGFPASLDPHRVFVTYSYGFSGDLGGGPYDRTESVERADQTEEGSTGSATAVKWRRFLDPAVWQAGVSHLHPAGARLFGSLRAAVAEWNAHSDLLDLRDPPGGAGVIVLMDSLSDLDDGGGPIEIRIGPQSRLLIVGADWPLEEDPDSPGVFKRFPGRVQAEGVRAHVVADLVVSGTAPEGSPDPGELFLNGVLLEGTLHVEDGHLGLLAVDHCTLVPDPNHGGIAVLGGNDRLRIRLGRSICGPVSVPVPIRRLELADCIMDGATGSPDAVILAATTEVAIDRSTVLGASCMQAVWASDSIFRGVLRAARRQTGCVRFSYLPLESEAPRRYRCQPDSETGIRATLAPQFVSTTYGDPGYGQLALRCPVEVRTGAESGAEMGAFCFLEQPQRESNLRRALDEYLRLGLEAGLFYAT